MKNYFSGAKEMFGKPNGNFKIVATIILLLLLLVLYWIFWPKKPKEEPIITTTPSEVVLLRDEVTDCKEENILLKDSLVLERAEVDRLKEYQVVLLDSIESMKKSAVSPPPRPRAYTKTLTSLKPKAKNCYCPPKTKAGYSPTPEQIRNGLY